MKEERLQKRQFLLQSLFKRCFIKISREWGRKEDKEAIFYFEVVIPY